jgi:hypothetical protein
MSESRLLLTFLAAMALAVAAITFSQAGRAEVAAGTLDPAIEHHTASHSAAYAGVDRWAFGHQSESSVTNRLHDAGYECASGQQVETVCTRRMRWPVDRILSIHVSLDPSLDPRVTALRAESRLTSDSSFARTSAAFLRSVGWMEPPSLVVHGFEIDDLELLSRMVADSLVRGGWAGLCNAAGSAKACGELARERRASGYGPIPDRPIGVGEAQDVIKAMERLRLDPVEPRGPDDQPDDALLVRVHGTEQWLDFEGADLAGHRFGVGLELAMEGGTPSKLVVRWGDQTRTLLLKGRPRTANGGDTLYLLPQAGVELRRLAIWLRAPDPQNDTTRAILRARLQQADPNFQPLLVKRFLDTLALPQRPDLALGLYPALLLVEQRGELLRDAGAANWLPRKEGQRLVAEAYAADPVTRAAWTFALCEPEFDAIGGDPDCWREALANDRVVAGLLDAELQRLQATYAALDPAHPLHARLERWQAVLKKD